MTTGAPSERTLGRYQLLFMLGQGGMGEVHLAKLSGAAGFEKLCIVKTILPQMQGDPQFVDRFHHEARVLLHLTHSNIAQVYDMGEVDGTLYMAIEYVPGVDLARVQSRAARARAAIPVPIALYLGQRIAEALGYAHRKTGPDGAPLGIVHRDVSPQNIMVSYEGEVKVIDFGLAKSAARSKHTLPSTVMGKLGYMSPEQAMAQPLDHRSDIYSAGIVLWELIAGRPLFEGGTMAEMVVKMANPTIPSLRSANPDVSAGLDQVVMRALAADPAARFSRADDFGRALNELAVREGLTIGSEDVGNYVRAMCPEEFAAERALQSKLSIMRKRGSANLATPLPSAPEIEGTLLRPSSPGAAAPELTPAQKALSVSDQAGPGVYAAMRDAPASRPGKATPHGRTPVPIPLETPAEETPSAPVELPRSKAPWIVVGVLGVAAVAVITAAFLKSREQEAPEPAKPVAKVEEPKVATAEPSAVDAPKAEEPKVDPAPKPLRTVSVSGPLFSVKQTDDELVVLLKDKKALRKGDPLDLVGEPTAEKTAPLYAEGVVMEVTGMVASIGVYDEAPLPPKVYAFKAAHEKPAAVRTVGKPRKTGATALAAGAPAVTATGPSVDTQPPPEVKPKVDAKPELEPVKVAVADPVVPAMNPDNPFEKTKAPPTPKPEPTHVVAPAVVQPVTAQPVAAQPAPTGSVTLKGDVQLIGPKGSGVARLFNKNPFSLNECILRLPGAMQYRFMKEIYAGITADVPLQAFLRDDRPPDPQFAQGWVPVYCREGRGYFKLHDARQ